MSREFVEEDDYGLIDEQDINAPSFADTERTTKAYAGVYGSSTYQGDDRLARLAKKISRITMTSEEIFVKKAERSINILNSMKVKIQKNEVENFIIKCKTIEDLKFKSSMGLILAGKYYFSNDEEKEKLLTDIEPLKISLIDIIKYIRLLKKYKII